MSSNDNESKSESLIAGGEAGQSPRVRDGKRLSGERGALLPFLKMVLIGVPLWLAVMLPLTLVCQIFLNIAGVFTPKKNAAAQRYECPTEVEAQLPAPGQAKPLAERKYDVVLLGATGFTGGLAAKYLAKSYGPSSGVKWAIAGRSAAKLEKVKAELNADYVDVIVCDTSKPETLIGLVADTRTVATTAGPFDRYGTPVVHMCAAHGTGYCDITGESDWVRQTVDRFDDLARSTGARIVHFCGHDCVPWDLAVMKVANRLRDDHGQALREVRCYDEINGAPSGGTVETLFHSLNARTRLKASLGFDPLLKAAGEAGEAAATGPKCTAANQSRLGYSSENGTWVGPFVMAMVMANCVRRSNAVNGYSAGAGKKPLLYKEAVVYPSFMAGFVDSFSMILFVTALFCPPIKYLLRNYVLPKPGQGPSEKRMDYGFLSVECVGVGDGGAEAKARIYFPTDPGYRDTARMIVESALALALDGDRVAPRGGCFTPAACQGDVLLERLVNTGTEFDWL